MMCIAVVSQSLSRQQLRQLCEVGAASTLLRLGAACNDSPLLELDFVVLPLCHADPVTRSPRSRSNATSRRSVCLSLVRRLPPSLPSFLPPSLPPLSLFLCASLMESWCFCLVRRCRLSHDPVPVGCRRACLVCCRCRRRRRRRRRHSCACRCCSCGTASRARCRRRQHRRCHKPRVYVVNSCVGSTVCPAVTLHRGVVVVPQTPRVPPRRREVQLIR
jgi:hypothetical protein